MSVPLPRCTSFYIPLRDSVRVAVTLYLPASMDQLKKVPTIIRQTRYFRAIAFRSRLLERCGVNPFDLYASTRRHFLQHGYAWLDVDVRGSGASYGYRAYPWQDQTLDGNDVVDWVIRQPWSNGEVGAMGISYDGTCADYFAIDPHPAVKAIAPRFCCFDIYADVAFPGGVSLDTFTSAWNTINMLLSGNRLAHFTAEMLFLRDPRIKVLRPLIAKIANAALHGVQPVDGDYDQELLLSAMAERADNYDIHRAVQKATYRDDTHLFPAHPHISIDRLSPHTYRKQMAASGIPFLSYSGWFDADYSLAAIKRFISVKTSGSCLIIGPWNHGGFRQCSPFRRSTRVAFNHDAALLDFFNTHLRPTSATPGIPPVRYYTLGEERWKSASTWPPKATPMKFYLDQPHHLSPEAPRHSDGSDHYTVDPTAGTGIASRWRTLISVYLSVAYPDRRKQDKKLLCYTSAPLTNDIEVTGHPLVSLFLRSSQPDGDLFIYLEEVDAKGRSMLVTEGQLRLIHHELAEGSPYGTLIPYRSFKREDAAPLVRGRTTRITLDFIPTSYRFRKGNRIRLAIGGSDRDNFPLFPGEPPTFEILRNKAHPSYLELPIVK